MKNIIPFISIIFILFINNVAFADLAPPNPVDMECGYGSSRFSYTTCINYCHRNYEDLCITESLKINPRTDMCIYQCEDYIKSVANLPDTFNPFKSFLKSYFTMKKTTDKSTPKAAKSCTDEHADLTCVARCLQNDCIMACNERKDCIEEHKRKW